MNSRQFNKEELIQLESLLQSATNISKIYDKLCELEIKNQKDTQEYKELITKLNQAIKEEDKKYQDYISNYHQCIKYATFLASKTNAHIFEDTVLTTIRNYDKRAVRRIILKLTNLAETNPNFQKKIIPDAIQNALINICPGITKNDLLAELNHNQRINQSLSMDINSMFLSILEDVILYKANNTIKNKLIEAKYGIIFSHKNLENMMIEYNFNMPSNVYVCSKILNEIFRKESLSYDIMKFLELKTQASQEINYLLAIRDQDYNNPETNINSVISQCYLRALLSLMSEKEVNKFNEEFQNKIESPKHIQEHLADSISENAIISCFKLFKKDKERVRTLSIKSNN